MLTVGDNPVIESTGGLLRPNVTIPIVSKYCRSPSFSKMSNPSVDLPEPDMPVRTMNLSFGILSEIFLRLCSRALLILITGPIESMLHQNEAEVVPPHTPHQIYKAIVKPWCAEGGFLSAFWC